MDILIGNFGKGRPNGAQNGQTQKALQVLRLLRCHMHLSVDDVDTSDKHVLTTAFLKAAISGKRIGICVGPKGLRFLSAVHRFLPKRGAKITIFAVGGWLAELASRSHNVTCLCRKATVLVETEGLRRELERIGVKSQFFPNFRDLPVAAGPFRQYDQRAPRLVFCGRITPAKGINKAVDLCRTLRRAGVEAILDFYGPIDSPGFLDLVRDENGVRYRGAFDNVAETVKLFRDYDFLVLPSEYPGECVPGAVVEAMFSGLPSIVSNWRFLPEIIESDVNGYICPLNNFAEFAFRSIKSIDEKKHTEMRFNCLQTADKDYSVSRASDILSRLI